MTWSVDAGESTPKIRYLTTPYTRGTGVDVGCGTGRLWPCSIGIGPQLLPTGAQISVPLDNLSVFASESMDYVYSTRALSDFPPDQQLNVLTEWCRVIKPKGYLVLYIPHEDFVSDQKGLSPQKVKDLMAQACPTGWTLVEDEVRTGGDEYSFYQVYHLDRRGAFSAYSRPVTNLPKCLVVRYGGFGDMLQTAAVFPAIRALGYEVHVNTTPKGQDILRHDPNIAGWWLQDDNQVPNADLANYWRALEERFEKIVNYSESVEASLLALRGRPNYNWPIELLRKRLNVSYTDRMFEIGGLTRVKVPTRVFFPSAEEKAKALAYRESLNAKHVVLWVLSGSSIHKIWPYTDAVIARLLLTYGDQVKVVFSGDALCQMLEYSWRDEPRVIPTCGTWSIRDTLAFAETTSVVVGPETGVLNSVGRQAEVGKVIMLSHSSPENLTKYWKNAAILTAEVSCYPCHRMHYSFATCNRDEESGAAKCAAGISADRVFEAIVQKLR